MSNVDTILEEARSGLKRLTPHELYRLRDALIVDTHQGWCVRGERANRQEHMLTTVNAAFIGDGSEGSIWCRQ